MKLKLMTAVSVFALSAVGSASAADIVMHHREIAPVIVKPVNPFSWTGFYIGGQGAYRWGTQKAHYLSDVKNNTDDKDKKDDKVVIADGQEDIKGASAGLFAGFNSNLDSGALLSIETDMLWNNLKGKNSYKESEDGLHTGVKEKWAGATRLRFGYAQDHVLPYLSGGIAYARLEYKPDQDKNDEVGSKLGGGVPILSGLSDKTSIGWTVGAGVDYAATDNIFVRLEYRYSDYGKKKYQQQNPDADVELKYRTHDVRVGVAYKF